MSHASEEAHEQERLLQRAAEKLGVNKPAAGQRASQTDALAVLHHLASSPTTARCKLCWSGRVRVASPKPAK